MRARVATGIIAGAVAALVLAAPAAPTSAADTTTSTATNAATTTSQARSATPATHPALSRSDTAIYNAAFAAVKAGEWAEARQSAAKAEDGLMAKLILWLDLRRADGEASTDEIAAFLDANPHWPRRATLRRRAEAAITPIDDPAAALAYFARYPALTGAGALAKFQAMSLLGRDREARDAIRRAWVDLDFKPSDETKFFLLYRRYLKPEDHAARIDRLIWRGQLRAATRMLDRVKGGVKALARARIALASSKPGVDALVAAVPKALRDDPALWYERLRWRRRMDLDDAAREILLTPPSPLPHPELWARERAILSRRAIEKQAFPDAYRIAAGHGLEQGATFAASEFLAGWIGLTFLDDPDKASARFTHLFENVRYPISRARGAYWAGRAAAMAGDEDAAKDWFTRAAEHPTTFYGQEALKALGRPFPRLDTAPGALDAEPPANSELIAVVRQLYDLGEDAYIPSFLTALADQTTTPSARLAVARLAHEVGFPALGIRLAKRAQRETERVTPEAFPLPAAVASEAEALAGDIEPALVLALVRQESGFDDNALSPAGARGLMQLLPGTARTIAQAIGETFSTARLTLDPAYNLRLGTAFLADLTRRYDGALPLVLAAYNAGPRSVERWLKTFGDPRTDAVDMIDWIELIPFSETRNYVQRVMETTTVYRQLLKEPRFAAYRPTHRQVAQGGEGG